MTKYKIRVNYLKLWGDDGTVYRLGFTVSQKIADIVLDGIRNRAIFESDHITKMYLNETPKKIGKVIFLNLTQRDAFLFWAFKNENIEIDKKRASYDANAYLIIKN